jgi:hypothetical protein
MWIFTEHGFITFVVDKKDPSQVWLRARMREHLADNFPDIEITEHPGADYFFRAKVSKTYLAEQMTRLIMDANITSHFKDEMNRRAAKPKWGSISEVMYAVWNGAAKWQPYAPYSRVPRGQQQATTWKNTQADRRPGQGQTALGFGGPSSTYGDRRGSEFDWDSKTWGGVSGPDPARVSSSPLTSLTDAEFDRWWADLSDEERDRILDEEEAEQRRREESEEDLGAAARAAEFLPSPEVLDVFPDPRNRPGNRRQRRKNRKNRHNQAGDYRRIGFSDSQAREEAANRQAYLDKKGKR